MTDPGEIVETSRTPAGDGSGQEDAPKLIHRNSGKRKGKRHNSRPQSPTQSSQLGQGAEEKRNEIWDMCQQLDGQKRDALQALFYDNYRRVAEEYDKNFLKKYGGDLYTILIFASLFSTITLAFIIEVDSQLQPGPGDETAAPLRIPTLPQWNAPPPVMVHVQAILFASLAISLLAASLAMIGKQWLSRYDSPDMRGSSIEQCHNRQRKVDSIDAWHFTHVVESLPLMLQASLLLLGCALSRYFWEVSIVVASVALGFTLFIVAGYHSTYAFPLPRP